MAQIDSFLEEQAISIVCRTPKAPYLCGHGTFASLPTNLGADGTCPRFAISHWLLSLF